MQAQLACVLLLWLTCGGLCSDADQEQRTLEEELLSELFSSKVKQQTRPGGPYGRTALTTLCRAVSGLRITPWQEAVWSAEEGEGEELGEGRGPTAEGLHDLQRLCRALQPQDRTLRGGGSDSSLQYGDQQNVNMPLKRKSPYILKRQAASTQSGKSRRPYILKRSTLY